MKNLRELLDQIIIQKGDITTIKCDAIVNAANPSLLGGGGVDGAIHKAAGPDLLAECRKIGPCKHGEARITAGYNLPAKHVIHTPGPIYTDGKNNEAVILKNSYSNSMKLALQNNLKSIAFPAISTGVYGYPKEEAATIAIETVLNFMLENNYFPKIYFILFDNSNKLVYNKSLKEI
jgi:O-acetyl-ADP-ribose deacetylase (regulator of RNase III)